MLASNGGGGPASIGGPASWGPVEPVEPVDPVDPVDPVEPLPESLLDPAPASSLPTGPTGSARLEQAYNAVQRSGELARAMRRRSVRRMPCATHRPCLERTLEKQAEWRSSDPQVRSVGPRRG